MPAHMRGGGGGVGGRGRGSGVYSLRVRRCGFGSGAQGSGFRLQGAGCMRRGRDCKVYCWGWCGVEGKGFSGKEVYQRPQTPTKPWTIDEKVGLSMRSLRSM